MTESINQSINQSIKLKNINIFQSEEQYIENEANLNATDLNLIPALTVPSADKLNIDAGGPAKPVYFKNGIPVECTSLNLEVDGVSESATKDGNGNVITETYISNLSVSGKTLTFTKGNGNIGTITTQDTTYSAATTSAAGLMSATDKSKLDGIRSGSAVCYGTCSTATSTNAKVATITSGTFSLTAGMIIAINFSNKTGIKVSSLKPESSEKMTLNVNSTGAKNIRKAISNGTNSQNDNDLYLLKHSVLYAGTYFFGYNGTEWHLLSNGAPGSLWSSSDSA